ncbi:MAG: hypothetical protein ACRD35_01160 [Candidatus Acidiferrales bacterium]
MKPFAELLFNLAALASSGALAYFFFPVFLAVVGTAVVVSLGLMVAEGAVELARRGS